MGLSDAAGAEDKQRIERLLVGVLGNRLPHTAGKLIAEAFYKVAEVLFRVELRVQVLCRSHSFKCAGGCVCRLAGGRVLLVLSCVALHVDGLVAGNIDVVEQAGVRTESTDDGWAPQLAELLLEIFMEVL